MLIGDIDGGASLLLWRNDGGGEVAVGVGWPRARKNPAPPWRTGSSRSLYGGNSQFPFHSVEAAFVVKEGVEAGLEGL